MSELHRSARQTKSLFRFEVLLAEGKKQSGKITAKTEDDARKRVAKDHAVVEWISLLPEKIPATTSKIATKPKSLSKLQKMLYLQNGRCFFCGEELPESEASIEHLNPKAKGGASTEDNEVVCHASLNQTFGSMDLKRKFEFVIRQRGSFRCPK